MDIANSSLAPLIPLGRADLATDFAFLYPIHVTAIIMCELDEIQNNDGAYQYFAEPSERATAARYCCAGRIP